MITCAKVSAKGRIIYSSSRSSSTTITSSLPWAISSLASGLTSFPIRSVITGVLFPSCSASSLAGVSSSSDGREILPLTTSAQVRIPLAPFLKSISSNPSGRFLAFFSFFSLTSSVFFPAFILETSDATSSVSLCPLLILTGALSLLMLATLATMVGEPLKPIFSSLKCTSSILKTVISVLRALIAPPSDGRLGSIPVGVKESAHGSGKRIIWYPPSMILLASIFPST